MGKFVFQQALLVGFPRDYLNKHWEVNNTIMHDWEVNNTTMYPRYLFHSMGYSTRYINIWLQ